MSYGVATPPGCCVKHSPVLNLRFLFGLVLVIVGAVAPAASGTGPVLEDARLRLAFQSVSGDLIELSSKNPTHVYLAQGAPQPLWLIEPLHGSVIGPGNAGEFTWDCPPDDAPCLEMVWGGFGLEESPDLKVIVTVSLDPGRAESRWRIRLHGLGGRSVRAVHFPRLCGIELQSDERLAVPEWMGRLTRRARSLLSPVEGPPKRWEWEYPGLLSMQFLAWYGDSGSGLLLATNDPSALRKQFAVFGDGQGGIGLEVVHQPPVEDKVQGEYAPPYTTLISPFSGQWYAAAQEYGRWARNQSWVRESRLKQGKTTSWAKNTGVWVWNRGRSEGVLGPAQRFQEEARLPISVFWHWWHGCPYDAGFPEYLPPREGEDSFRKALVTTRGKGIHSLVYMNQRLWGMTTRSWSAEGAERYAVKGPDGKVTPEVYNVFMKVPCASMCMGTPFWREKYAGLAAGAVGLGVDGIYMDQACSSLSCYDPTHGHPLGGGSYWMDGFRNLEAIIRERCDGDHPVTLAGEGCGEAWLPHLDLMLSLQVSMERYAAPGEWEPIPFFQAVYHDCVLLYGNYSSLTRPPYDDLWPPEFAPEEPLALLDRRFAAQFRMEQSRAFVWGQQPTLANFTQRLLDERREEINFFLQLARLRHENRAFLQEGMMLAPLPYTPPQAEIPLSRLSIYAGQQDSVKEYVAAVPLVFSSVWLAPDKRVGVALANISEHSQPVRFRLPQSEYPISLSGTIRRHAPGGGGEFGCYSGGEAVIDLSLDPASACLLEFIPDSERPGKVRRDR
jgi:hypothetical protein